MIHCCHGRSVALRICKYLWIYIYFQRPRIEWKSKTNRECLAVRSEWQFSAFLLRIIQIALHSWDAVMEEQYLEESSCSLGYCRFLWQVSSLLCSRFHTNETRRLPSALPATPGGCELKTDRIHGLPL